MDDPEPVLAWDDDEEVLPRHVAWAKHAVGVDAFVSVVQRRPSDLWRLKETLWEQEKRSRACWGDMSDDERMAAAELITSALRRLLEDPLAWLPSTITPVGGDRLDVTLSLQLPSVSDAAIRRLAQGARTREAMLSSLQALQEQLADDEEPTG